jgi:hypothetical protein
MPSGVPDLALTHTFNGDGTAANYVNAAKLDQQLALIVQQLNTSLKAGLLDLNFRNDNALADSTVRQRHLHPELGTIFPILRAHVENGMTVLTECRVATRGNVDLAGLVEVDSRTLDEGDRVLVRAQEDPTENGVYLAHADVWERATDADSLDVIGYAYVYVDDGARLSQTGWLCDIGGTGVLGTVDVRWKRLFTALRTGGGGLVAAEDVSVTNDGYDNAQEIFDALLHQNLVPSLSGGSDVQKGHSVASVSLAWGYNKAISAQSLSGTGTTPPALGARAQTVAGPFVVGGGDKQFTIQGTAADDAALASASTWLRFKSKRFWGVSALSSLDSSGVLALAGSELATARQQSRVLAPSSQYIWFAWPQSFGGEVLTDFTVNGLANTAYQRSTLSFTNSDGYVENYYLFRSALAVVGSYTVGVQ